MNYGLLYRTVRHLRPIQVLYQVKYRLKKPVFMPVEAPNVASGSKFQIPYLKTEPIARFNCLNGDRFTFLNLEHEFAGWNFVDNGMLWAYNQNYFDWINQESISRGECCQWIDKFIKEQANNTVGLDPYPTALRSINWTKFFCRYPECATTTRLNSLYSQLQLLEKELEFHLCGNHLLEDAYALFIGGSFFNDKSLLAKANKLLLSQLEEQVLKDGAHFEQSPMYHCILLDRLLDCINIDRGDERERKERFAVRMLGHLDSMIWKDGTLPMLNDAANGIAPAPVQIFDYARHLGLEWEALPLKECGYRKMTSETLEAFIDVGDITAIYQPGHSHADTFNYELRIDGKPYVVDTGISTYNKTGRRQLERSSLAHNCVSPNGENSSEVWGGFRVGKRCHTVISVCTDEQVEASHDGYSIACRRKFKMKDGCFIVEDWYDNEAVSYIHLAQDADENRIKIEGALSVESKPWKYSLDYNRFIVGKVIEIRFKGHCKYTIDSMV